MIIQKYIYLYLIFSFLIIEKVNADTSYVNVMSNFFEPANFTVEVGDFVKWTLMDASHTTTSNTIPSGAASWDYTFTGIGDSFVYEVMEVGTYNYECLFHPGMNGSFTAIASLPDTVDVNVMSNFFEPADFTVDVGDFIKWTLVDGSHTTTSNSIPSGAASWDYTFTGMGDSFIYEATEAGFYNYECLFHLGMNGSFAVLDPNTFLLTVTVDAGWNMVSIPGLHPLNQNVGTWWSGKDPAANVFRYSSGYQSVSDATPTEGYWMKNLGAQIYNTGDEWPAIIKVPHDPINVNGWSLIGVYECPVAVSGITTNPPGGIQSSFFGFSGGYQVVDTLLPGYGYWIKAVGQLILPPCNLFDNTTRTVQATSKNLSNQQQSWGKIIITDNSGRSSTLYAVNGGVNLDLYELPSVPPAELFDVRYNSGRYAEFLNTQKQIDLRGISYPLKIKAENIDIEIKDETEKLVNVRLKPGEEITINHNLNKLIVVKHIMMHNHSH